jgi:lysophospholipase L1-like esterase
LLRRAVVPALLVAASLLTTGLAIELGFRAREAWRRSTREPWALFDAHLGYRLNPARPDHNPQGFRDHPFPPKSQRFRILMLGDSLAYNGDDVDDTWVAYLRRELQARPALSDLEVLNAGVPGYTNYQELRWLELHGLALEPDLVGVGFVLNDLYHFLQRLRVEDGRVTDRFEPTPEALGHEPPAIRALERHSRFLAWLSRRLGSLGVKRDADRNGFAFDDRVDLRAAWQDARWKDVEGQLRAMQRLGEREGFDVFLVVFPIAEQYDARKLARDRDYVLKPQRKLREICGRLRLSCLDLYPWLDAARDLEPDGIHLSGSGRRHVGAITAGFVIDRALLARRIKPVPGGAEAAGGAYVPEGAQGAIR